MDFIQTHERNSRIRSYVQCTLAEIDAIKVFGGARPENVMQLLDRRGIDAAHPHRRAAERLMIEKSAVPAAAPNSWGGALVDNILRDAFIARVRERDPLGRIDDVTRRVPFQTMVPLVAAGSTAEWRGAGRPAIVSSAVFDRVSLAATAIATIIVITDELARSANPLVVDMTGSDAVTAIVDRIAEHLFSHEPEIADVQPPGLLNGLASVGTGSPADTEDDVKDELFGSVRGGEPIAPRLYASRSILRKLAKMRDSNGDLLFPDINLLTGGTILGVPVLISKGAGGNLILLDAAALAVADGGVELSVSNQTALQMDDSPTDGPANLVSLFQANSTALRVTRFVNWQKAYDDAVAYYSIEGGSPA